VVEIVVSVDHDPQPELMLNSLRCTLIDVYGALEVAARVMETVCWVSPVLVTVTPVTAAGDL
jgi:hypothetical protein